MEISKRLTTLQTLSEFLLRFNKDFLEDDEFKETYIGVYDYAEFLKQPLKLEMFIPCKDGEPLEDPETTMMQGDGQVYYGASDEEFKEYQQALDRVIFKGFKLIDEYPEWDEENDSTIANNEGVIFLITRDGKFYNEHDEHIKTIQDLEGKVELTDKKFKELGL